MIIPLFFSGGSATGSEEVTATSNQVLKGYTAVTNDSNDEPIEGTIESEEEKICYVTDSDQVIVFGNRYLSGNILINKITQTNLASGNILRGKTITISNGLTNIWSITGNTGNLKHVSGSFTAYSNTQTTVTSVRDGNDYAYAYTTINSGLTVLFCLSKAYSPGLSTVKQNSAYLASNSIGYLCCGLRNGPNYVYTGLPVSTSSNVKIYYNYLPDRFNTYASVEYHIFGY